MKINAADLIVNMDIQGELMLSRAKPYEYFGDKETDINISVSKKYYEDMNEQYKELTFDECEYLWSGIYFYENLLRYNGILLHSSCVEYNGKAYLFSAPSGTGKSTHTHLWLKYIDGTRIINDDKPAIRLVDGKFYAYGTPWSGKTNESINIGVPVEGIAFISRGENKIEKMTGVKAIKNFMDQTVRPNNKELAEKMLEILNNIMTDIPIYDFSCDMSKDAVMTSFNGMVKKDLNR